MGYVMRRDFRPRDWLLCGKFKPTAQPPQSADARTIVSCNSRATYRRPGRKQCFVLIAGVVGEVRFLEVIAEPD